MARPKKRSPFGFALLALSLLTCGIREDELRCEEAVAHLVDCCPGFDAKAVDCYFTSSSCGTVNTAYDIEESRCIAKLDCATLRANGVCSRAQSAQPNHDATARVCP